MNLHLAEPPEQNSKTRSLPLQLSVSVSVCRQFCICLGMQDYDLDYDVQEVRLSEHIFKVTTVANDALPLEMLMQLQERRSGKTACFHPIAD